MYVNLPYAEAKAFGSMLQKARRGKSREERAARPKMFRFDARLNEEQKLMIQRAADLEGRTMTEFVLRSAQAAAERTIQRRAMLVLSAREAEVFAASILNPAKPGPVLRKAAREYFKKTTSR